MLKAFNKYVNNFDISNEDINRKIEHSVRVYEKMKDYAKKLGYTPEEVKIAGEIGLLHDIGRFEQITKTSSFRDTNNFEHADYGVSLLFIEDFIENFKINPLHYKAIEYAIKYHNKYELPKNNNPLIMKMAKLIRDIDKLDIMYILSSGIIKEKADESEINSIILDSIKKHRQINWKDVKSNNDTIAVRFALAFDINNDMCLKEFSKYLKKYYNSIEYENKFKEIYEIANNYLEERMK